MTLKEIEKLSPVKIYYKQNPEYGTAYFSCMEPHEIYQERHIEIDADLCLAERIVATLHEIGHAIHHVRNCKCFEDITDHTLAEYHAYRFTMKHIKNNNELIKVFVANIDKAINSDGHEHKTAAKRIIKLKSYAKLVQEI